MLSHLQKSNIERIPDILALHERIKEQKGVAQLGVLARFRFLDREKTFLIVSFLPSLVCASFVKDMGDIFTSRSRVCLRKKVIKRNNGNELMENPFVRKVTAFCLHDTQSSFPDRNHFNNSSSSEHKGSLRLISCEKIYRTSIPAKERLRRFALMLRRENMQKERNFQGGISICFIARSQNLDRAAC